MSLVGLCFSNAVSCSCKITQCVALSFEKCYFSLSDPCSFKRDQLNDFSKSTSIYIGSGSTGLGQQSLSSAQSQKGVHSTLIDTLKFFSAYLMISNKACKQSFSIVKCLSLEPGI